MNLLKRLIPDNLAGVLGVVQAIVKFVRELCILVVRVFGFWIPDEPYEKWINKVAEIAEKVDGGIERLKNSQLS